MYGSQNSFADLMSMARQNADEAKRKVAHTNLLPDTTRPRRADPKQVKLKEGVAKFLAKRDEEDKKKKEEEKLKKERLLQLRNQDRKAANRVRKMLSMTKSANKSCIEDANHCLSESVAAQGEFQPDEDDYGYTSNYADMMHKKLMDKYNKIPIKPVFSDSKVPVPKAQSLQKNGTGWRNNKSNYEDEEGYSPEQQSFEQPVPSKKPEKTKVPKKPPPPDYRQLLQLAQQKQMEPVLSAKPIVDKKGEKEDFEFGRPMTAKEKAAYLAEKELRERSIRQFQQKSDKNNNSPPDSRPSKPSVSFKIPKAKTKEEETMVAPVPTKKSKISEPVPGKPLKEVQKLRPIESNQNTASTSVPNPPHRPVPSHSANGLKPSSSAHRPTEKPSKPHSSSSPPSSNSIKNDQRRSIEQAKSERNLHVERKTQERKEVVKELIQEKPRYLSAFEGGRERERERDHVKKPTMDKSRPGSSRDISQNRAVDFREKPRKPNIDSERRPMKRDVSPPSKRDLQAPRREMPPPSRRDLPLKSNPHMREELPRMKPKPNRGRAIIDSDEEYDSEMDDFIDDSEVDMGNISAEISRIFKYDRRKYHYDESDDECMESSVAEQLREEQRSLRIGIQEDLEDIRREEEEKKRKLMKMKKRR